jgi:hypothetical protein
MSLQYIIDLASEVNFDFRSTVGQQVTRSGIVRVEQTVNRQPWRVSLTMPPIPWTRTRAQADITSTIRSVLPILDTYRYTPQTVKFNNTTNTQFFWNYQGGPTLVGGVPANVLAFVQSWTGNQLVVNTLNTALQGMYYYKAGDIISMTGNGYRYPFVVMSDVFYTTGATSLTVTTHRPNFFTTSVVGRSIRVGDACQFEMMIETLPEYRIYQGAQEIDQYGRVGNKGYLVFDGPITLIESLAGAN